MQDVKSTVQVLVANGRIQDAFSEADVVQIVQRIVSNSVQDIVIHSLDDWLALPLAKVTDTNGVEIPADARAISPDLVDTAISWEKEFLVSR